MSSTLRRPWPSAAGVPWLVALAGFAAMYLPSYWAAANDIWQEDELGHGPIILAIALWLFWQVREEIARAPDRPLPMLGWPLLGIGLLLYGFGRILSVPSAEFLSQLLVVVAALLLLKGVTAVRAAWFAVFYLTFMVPLPATLVNGLTGSLKEWVSLIVVDLLHLSGYPIARTGVMITIGQYQLLVADACSGLNSMFSLSALGTLFMYVMARPGRLHNTVMLMSIIPIAFFANIIRVVVLVLVTYHLGDEAGQGFLHGAAGIVLMLVALVAFFALDAALNGIAKMVNMASTRKIASRATKG